MKVLVVDDNEFMASSIQRALEHDGKTVMWARNGMEGYLSYIDFRPDLIITDIQMPGESGLDMMKHIRTHNSQVKTIYMSGNIDLFRSSLEKEKQEYPVTFFQKPFSLETLRGLVS